MTHHSTDPSHLPHPIPKVLFDLQAHEASAVLVPGYVAHGTPAIAKEAQDQLGDTSGGGALHGAIGAVIFTKVSGWTTIMHIVMELSN